ncbi:MAG: DUF4238 domain-containing protein [Smithellaceae bacterium]
MTITRRNHYVPVWYQKRFLPSGGTSFYYVDLCPEKRTLSDGRVIPLHDCCRWGPNQCFWEKDLYTTSFFGLKNDEIERFLFGAIDSAGSASVSAIIDNDMAKLHDLFNKFFEYLDAQKIRTPKGLDWIKTKYPRLTQLQLMFEMQQLRQMHCTMWVEAVREIVSAEDSDVKFIITDHPVTIYNPACPPDSDYCKYPEEPSISFKGSQIIVPLDLNRCLILTNLEYARDPQNTDLLTNRTNARNFGQTISRIDTMIRSRKLKPEDVGAINYILKARARRYIAAGNKKWLYPEHDVCGNWVELGKTLLPPKNELWHFGGEMYIGYEDGSTHYQDEFGRTVGDLSYLKKPARTGKIGVNEPCICGSGKKYKKCCRDKAPADRPIATVRSIRERNLMFIEMVVNILGLAKGKTWDDVRKELSDKQVKDIHGAFGCLWPPETNVVDMLPRPDNKIFRALYSGLIDPRIILRNVASFSLYFDEIIVINPFMNPAYVKPEFSPVESPGQYKQETLKNVLLLMQLAPFIEAGVVNLIPDPCTFNHSLRQQIWDMAKARLKDWKPDPAHMKPMEELTKDDFKRSWMAMSDDSLRRNIKTALPELSDEQVKSTLEYMKKKQAEDPLALLQPVARGEKSGQFLISHLSPNFELGFFLAQITGSILYTDNLHRWGEINAAVNPVDILRGSPWDPLSKCMNELDMVFEINPVQNLQIRKTGKLGLVRDILRRINAFVQEGCEPDRIKELSLSLSNELVGAHKKLLMEFDLIQKQSRKNTPDIPVAIFKGRLNCVIPTGGFGVNAIHRLLLSYGSINYLKSVPMAMFIKYDESVNESQ